MTSTPSNARICGQINAKVTRGGDFSERDAQLAALFGLAPGAEETLYNGLEVDLGPGEILAIVGPSGAGKSVLLKQIAALAPAVYAPRLAAVARAERSPLDFLPAGDLPQRLELLARCGLADAAALVTPARRLSGGQQYRLALAEAVARARRSRRRGLALLAVDEFGGTLDAATAAAVARQLRRLIHRSGLAAVVASPREDILSHLRPDWTVAKPLAAAARWVRTAAPPAGPADWPIRTGDINHYRQLGMFHYLAGPPAAHKRVFRVPVPAGERTLAGPDTAAVLVVSPPLLNVRGRNLATGGRYIGRDRRAAAERLNRELECISRVVVHPLYRGEGLAVRLVAHALATAETPATEALAAMGAVHPFFQRAGMTAYPLPPNPHSRRLLKAAEAVGLAARDLAAVGPVRKLLARGGRRAGFLRKELDLAARRHFGPRRLERLDDPTAAVCRAAGRQYVYYHHRNR